jgi:hypothetical protein
LSIWITCGSSLRSIKITTEQGQNAVVVLHAKTRDQNDTSLRWGVNLTSKKEEAASADNTSDSLEAIIGRLKAHIVALESELANYASRYGLTDRARELLSRPVAD